jgi:alkylhydroperoxidase family enzyme
MTKKMKMIELQMRQARLIKDSEKIDAYVQARRREAGLDEEEIAEGRIIGDRTAMLAEIMKNLPENDK